MILRALILLFSSIFLYDTINAQASNQYEIINNILYKDFNNKIPILDSLFPLQKMPFLKKDFTFFSKKEIKELKNSIRHSKGLKLNKDLLGFKNIIPAVPIFNAFKNLNDTINLNIVAKAKPFYILSTPIIFSNDTKAIISVLLMGGFSTTYIIERKKGRWEIDKNICQMMQ